MSATLRQINHAAAAAAHAALLAALANKALRLPHLDVAQRPGFDRDYGSFTDHPLDPRTPEPADDELSEDQARDAATDQVLATPAIVANWLQAKCAADGEPVDVQALAEHAVIEASVPALLAVLLSGSDTHAQRALHRLRELAIEQNQELINERASSLLACEVAA